ncbi:MAG TPA: SDR family oxidoreductase [Candidatus Limnocylindrales bacterium]
MADERFLVTGGTGCIGSWVVRDLVRAGVPVTVLTAHRRLDRLALLLDDAELAGLDLVEGDVTDLDALEAVGRARRVTHLVHLAALQFPFCAADPVAGARVNVQGTVTMFELARRLGIGRLVYASSAAVYGPRTRYADEVLPADAELFPVSHYGVYKVANEQGARVAWETGGIASVGLRPHSVYGPGRDQGVTSKPTLAMLAAAVGRPFHIDFGGRYQFQFADDVARAFIAATRAELPGASVFSLPGPAIGVDEVLAAVAAVEPTARGSLTFDDRRLPFPAAFDGAPFEAAVGALPLTPLEDGVRRTIETYRAALAAGRLDAAYLDRVLAA